MLSIFASKPITPFGRHEKDWWVGNPAPVSFHDINNIQSIQMDGDELEHVKIQYKLISGGYTLPIPYGVRVVRLFGDDAKTVVANL